MSPVFSFGSSYLNRTPVYGRPVYSVFSCSFLFIEWQLHNTIILADLGDNVLQQLKMSVIRPFRFVSAPLDPNNHRTTSPADPKSVHPYPRAHKAKIRIVSCCCAARSWLLYDEPRNLTIEHAWSARLCLCAFRPQQSSPNII